MPKKGYKQIEEHKRKVNEKLRKYWSNPENRKKVSERMEGIKFSGEKENDI